MRFASWALTLLFVTPIARANDSSFGGSGADLVPLKETRVRMQSEEIVLTFVGSGGDLTWHVDARYRFHNPTQQRVPLTLGFPESRCEGSGEDCYGRGGEFQELTTLVDGEPVAQTVGKVARRSEWGSLLGRVFLYSVDFAPRQTVEVVHRYWYDRSPHVTGEFMSYLTRTGRLWGAPIGHAKFVVRLPMRFWYATAPASYRLVSNRELPPVHGTHPTSTTELVFEMSNWTPTEDFNLYFSTVWITGLAVFGLGDCPVPRDGEALDPFPNHDRTLLERCRALPLALHGAPLPAPLSAFFYGPRELSEEERLYAEAGEGQTPPNVIRLQPSPGFRQSFLTDAEQRYIAEADEALAALNPQAPVVPSSASSIRLQATPPPAVAPNRGCGCSVPGAEGGAAALLALPWLFGFWRARRRRWNAPSQW